MLIDAPKIENTALPDVKNRLGVPCLIVIMAVLYNTVLAFVNANVTPLSGVHVVLSEGIILAIAICYLAMNFKNLNGLTPHILFLGMVGVLAMIVMMANGELFIKIIRDMAIMVIFLLLGTLVAKQSIIKMFKILVVITLVVAGIEIVSTATYVSMFEPATYYQNTRGVDAFGDSGLFRGAITSDTRFSFGFLSSHRIASVFLEQVSLANFALVTTLFLASFWKMIGRREALFFAGAILFFIMSNDTRTGSIFVLMMIPGYFIFPYLPKWGAIMVMPSLLFVAAVLFYDPNIDRSNWTDDFTGRLGLTMHLLSEIDIKMAFMGQLGQAISYVQDSGYVYVIYALTLFGAILYWLYISLIVQANDAGARRYMYGLNMFIAINLLIGAAVFTIKIAAPLWLLAGYFYKQNKRGTVNA